MNPQISTAVEALYASGQVQRPQSNKDTSLCFEEGMWWWRWGGDGPNAAGISAIRPDSVIFESLTRACWAKGWQPRQCFGDHFAVEGCNTSHMVFLDPIDAMISALNGGG